MIMNRSESTSNFTPPAGKSFSSRHTAQYNEDDFPDVRYLAPHGESSPATVSSAIIDRSWESVSDWNTDHSRTSMKLRQEVAATLALMASRLAKNCRSASFAADLALLKRELARAHSSLRLAGEPEYLAIVTLVERAVVSMDWSRPNRRQLDRLHYALDIGAIDDRVSFDHYKSQLKALRGASIQTGPVINFEDDEEDDDGEGRVE